MLLPSLARLKFAAFALTIGAMPAVAENSAPALGDTGQADAVTLDTIEVISQELDAARLQIQPSLGASTYYFGPQALEAIPQGENAPLNQVLLQMPAVAQDSFGQIHVRGEHANVQFRINGVQLPEGLSVFGQALEARLARSISLLTGALPAQYGFYTAGVLDIETKTGLTNPGLALTMYGGSFNWLQPSFDYGGREGPVDWFFTSDHLSNGRGIENPAATYNAIHDATEQLHGFSYMSGIIDPNTRVSMIGGAFDGRFQIPNNPGQSPSLGLNVLGQTTYSSNFLNEVQHESDQFAILSLQKHVDDFDMQASAFVRNSVLSFSPDVTADLLFNGVAPFARKSGLAEGVQVDASYRINDSHMLRGGFLGQVETTAFGTTSSVLRVDAAGMQTSVVPINVIDNGARTGGLYGVYLQDEWRISPALTFNAGLRFDAVNEFTNESQLSPRVNAVWKPSGETAVHAGYARYFVPPPFELVAPTAIALFNNTTAAPAVQQDGTVKAERSNYFDAGINQIIAPGLTIGLDGYYKLATNLIDEGQFGAPVILTAFNYAKAIVDGIVLSISYDQGPWSVYGNAAYGRALGTNIISSQFNFAPDELAYIANHYIRLDHDQTWTASGGAAYTFNKGTKFQTLVSADLLVQSGLRASTPTVPNGASLPEYAVVNASIVQMLDLGIGQGTELRLDVLNIGDAVYQIRNGTGVGVGAPQFGIRRTILAGLTQRF
jgi:outer membrane receptor protein involved in Fe transport